MQVKKNNNNFKKIKRWDFAGNKYKVFWRKPTVKETDGYCFPPEPNGVSKVYINPNLKERDFLITILDEAISACAFNICNEHVEFMSQSIGEFLYEMGWRLPKDKEDELE